MSTPRHVVIVGGGITGLTTAYSLQEEARRLSLPLTFTLLESNPTLGGKIVTERVGGFVIEGGPDSLLTQKPWAADLCRRLGLGDDLIPTNDDRRQTFVVNRGRLTPLPDGMMLIVPTRIRPFVTSPLISWPGKARMALDFFIPPRRDDGDESIAAFVRRRLGQEALEKLAEPLMSGIHVADPERQSLLGTFPRYREIEKRHGSLIRGMLSQRRAAKAPGPARSGQKSAFLSLRNGLGQLIEALESALDGGRLITGCRAVALERGEGPRYRIRAENGSVYDADAVVLATPAQVSASLLTDLSPALVEALSRIRYVSTATISLAFQAADVGHPLDGFGFVVPRREQRRILACTWSSTKFDHRAPPDAVLLRCFVGGSGNEELVGLGDDELEALVREELLDLMGLRAQPTMRRIFRWYGGNPQYDVGHPELVRSIAALAAREPGLYLTGSAFDGVGVPDCVRQGQETARKVLDDLRR